MRGASIETHRDAVGNRGVGPVRFEAATALEPSRPADAERLGLGDLGHLEIEQHALGEEEEKGVGGTPISRTAPERAKLGGPGARPRAAQVEIGVDSLRVALERDADLGNGPIRIPCAQRPGLQLEELGAAVRSQRAVAEPLPERAARRAARMLHLPQAVARADESPGVVEIGEVPGLDVRNAVDVGRDRHGRGETLASQRGVPLRRVGARGERERREDDAGEAAHEDRASVRSAVLCTGRFRRSTPRGPRASRAPARRSG